MGMANKVVTHYTDGKILKGITYDFNPTKTFFHLAKNNTGKDTVTVATENLKALFFVKSFEGNKEYKPPAMSYEKLEKIPGIKLRVLFADKEEMYGTTQGYSAERKGFFLIPVDKKDNNQRVFVMRDATRNIQVIR